MWSGVDDVYGVSMTLLVAAESCVCMRCGRGTQLRASNQSTVVDVELED